MSHLFQIQNFAPFSQTDNVVTGPETWGNNGGEDSGETPLHVAARSKHAAVIKLLLENGADVNAVDDLKQTVLKHAVHAGEVAVVQLLLEHGAEVDVGDDSCLPATYDNSAITEILLAHHPRQSAMNHALSDAAEDNPQVALLLLSAGAEADIYAASSLGLNDRVANLLEADPRLANPEQPVDPRERPLSLAAKKGHIETIRLLLAKRADIQPIDESTGLQPAADSDHLEIMDLLLAHGADVNHKDEMGASVLLAAAEAGHVRSVVWLIEHEADPLIRDVYRSTSLHAAARWGASNVVRILVKAGVPVTSRNDFRETPLHEASVEGQTETAQLLLRLGADVNARNRRRQTPLYYAERVQRFGSMDRLDRSPVAALLRSSGGIK